MTKNTITWEKIPEHIQPFVKSLVKTANDFNTSVEIKYSKYVNGDGFKCGGYYDPDDKSIKVAIKRPLNIWLGVLVHESCHMDQDIEQCKAWRDSDGEDATLIHDLWLAGEIELNENQIKKWTQLVQYCELDCEKRAAQKIKQYNLPLDRKQYIKYANAYVYFYTVVGKVRQWYTKTPYGIKEIYELMPEKFLKLEDYWHMPDELLQLYKTHCFGITT
jgi:hypothetical protein